jgi:hypothetical protein
MSKITRRTVLTNRGEKPLRRGTLADFFAASPLRNSGLMVEREKDAPRLPDFATTESKSPSGDEESA